MTTPPPPKLGHLPIQQWGFYNCPAIPFWALPDGSPDPQHVKDTVAQLEARGTEPSAAAAYAGLSTTYSLGGNSSVTAYEALYGGTPPGAPPDPANPLTRLPLEAPDQFTLDWTNDGGVYTGSLYLRDKFADTLKSTKKDDATQLFWPTIANFGIPYNLLMLSKVTKARGDELAVELGDAWTDDMPANVEAGLVFEINTRIIETVEPYAPPGGAVRFAPGCITVLTQNSGTKALTPAAVKLFTAGSTDESRVYSKGGANWIYALQAAKASITVWGIWLGHVGHWHIPTAAMQMTMYNTLPDGHPLMTFLKPISEWLIDFDFVLLQAPGFYEGISPPTPVAGPIRLLDLLDRYAAGRTFFDQDPYTELSNQGIQQSDFSRSPTTPWDAYPIAGYLTKIYDICQAFATVVVSQYYKQDTDVQNDEDLQKWITASNDPADGNVKLGEITTTASLTQLLTSLLYRVTAHAAGSLTSVVNPALAFTSNFPPCLQSTEMPEPTDKELTDAELLERLPYTGTIGTMGTFYFTFAYTDPYVPAVPAGGVNLDPYWPATPGTPADAADDACNAALFKYRSAIEAFVTTYTNGWNAELALIGGVPVGPIPDYANPVDQVKQWPRSIEI